MNNHNPHDEALMAEGKTIKVFGSGIRYWHWIMAFSIVVLAATGFFIGQPLPSVTGHASDWFLMGYIRFVHFAFGYIFAIVFIWRIYLAIVGGHHAREFFILPIWKKEYYQGLFKQAMHYGFLAEEEKHAGHNPLAHTAMFSMVMLGSIYLIFTGFALYAEGAGSSTWYAAAFGWVRDFHGNSLTLHTFHRIAAWLIIIFAMIHTYMVIRGETYSRSTVLSVMFSGTRTFRS